jgi:hypothetical protein
MSKFNNNINDNFSKFINVPKPSQIDLPTSKILNNDKKFPSFKKHNITLELQNEESEEEIIERCESPNLEMDKIYNSENTIQFKDVEFEVKTQLNKENCNEPQLKLFVEKLILQKKFKKNGWTF